jgi:type II secretion system protein J
MRRRRVRQGFTLVEMLVAIVIFIIFLGSIYGVYSAAQVSMAKAEESEEVFQTGRVLMARLAAEVISAYPMPGTENTGFVGEDTGNADAEREQDILTLLTTAHGTTDELPAGDLIQLRYRMDDPALNETPGLYLELRRTPGLELEDAQPEAQLLSPRVVSFNVRYWTAEGEEQAEWPDGPTLPAAVMIELAVQSDQPGAKSVAFAEMVNLALATKPAATTAGASDNPGENPAANPGAGGGANANP